MNKKLLFFIVFLVLLQVVTFSFSESLIKEFVKMSQNQGLIIQNASLLDSLNEVINISIYLSLIIIIPVSLYLGYLWGKDALYSNERKVLQKSLSWLILPVASFILGLGITHKVILPFLIYYSNYLGIKPTTTINSLITLYIINGFIMSAISFFPIITKILNNLNILSKQSLINARAKLYLISIILIAIITPTTDAVSLLIMIVPLVLFYELSILLCKKEVTA